jgi:hypothetical protein
VRVLRITGIKLNPLPAAEPLHTPDWLSALLMSASPIFCKTVQTVILSFTLLKVSDMDCVAWAVVEHALSPTRCPRLQDVRLRFTSYDPVLTRADVTERLPELVSRGDVKITSVIQ